MSRQDEVTEAFTDECRFAKIVQTPRGDAILIGGHVIELSVPPFVGGNTPPAYVQAIVTALRRGQNPSSIMTSIVGSTDVGKAA